MKWKLFAKNYSLLDLEVKKNIFDTISKIRNSLFTKKT